MKSNRLLIKQPIGNWRIRSCSCIIKMPENEKASNLSKRKFNQSFGPWYQPKYLRRIFAQNKKIFCHICQISINFAFSLCPTFSKL